MRKSRTHFEQVPIEVVRRIAIQEILCSQPVPCVICRKPVNLEDCKIDHNGAAVHETCYVDKVARS